MKLDLWTDPVTGLKVPKNPLVNLKWRVALLRAAETDTGLQSELYTACSLSLLYWVNAFMFTYRVFITDETGITRQGRPDEAHVPFVTWAIQDEHLLELEKAVNIGYDLLTDKTRDMGATWDHIAIFHHQWLFRADRNFLEISRKEVCVDTFGKTGEAGSDPGTLFGKHDYVNRWLPKWMRPAYDRKRMHLVNLLNNSRIDGETSGASAGSSDRRTAILLDEMAKMKEGEGIKRSTKDVTACRLANSTPDGPGTAFSKWRQSGKVKVFVLPWWEHPEKGLNRHAIQTDLSYWKIKSPWYIQQEKERTPKEMAIDIDMDHIGSGTTFFESHNIELHRQMFARPCYTRMTIDFRENIPTNDMSRIINRSQRQFISAQLDAKGPWRFYTHLINGRLDQTKTYICGIDISKGQGASNSIIDVMCVETREIVAEFADANTPPYELARIAVAAAVWIGGARKNGRPFLIWEANGPGWDFGRQVVKLYQYSFYFVDHKTGVVTEKKSQRYGWNSSPTKKNEVLGLLRRAFAHGGFITRIEECLDEALMYVYYDGGGIGPACYTEESAQARQCHGDRVIGHMLCLLGIQEIKPVQSEASKPPYRSMGYRRQQVMRRKKREKTQRKRRFDFSREIF